MSDNFYNHNLRNIQNIFQQCSSTSCSQKNTNILKCDSIEQINNDFHIVPDGTKDKDIYKISCMLFIRMFMSGKLVFFNDTKEYYFGYEDLRDFGEIGHGRYGCVNKMMHIQTKKFLAVKSIRLLMNKFDDSDSVCLLKQLQNEVKIIKDAASKFLQVVFFYGVTFYEGDLLICTELMDLSLKNLYKLVHFVAKEKFNENIFGIIAISVLNALYNLKPLKHIIYRNIKPSNILLNLSGEIKLSNFGISDYLEDLIIQTKEINCRSYTAPEQLIATAKEVYNDCTDVWCLGITLIETARGHFPYSNFNEKCFFSQLQELLFSVPILMNSNDNYSLKTIKFVNMCLEKDYLNRPTYEELMQTEFYKYFNNIQNKSEYVKNYVQEMLSLNKK